MSWATRSSCRSSSVRSTSPAPRDVIAILAEEFHGPVQFALHGFTAPAFWLAFAGFALATLMYLVRPELPAKAAQAVRAADPRARTTSTGMDDLWIKGFAGGSLLLGKLSRKIDEKVIDGAFVNGSARFVDLFVGRAAAHPVRFLYHYAFAMILGLIALLAVLIRYWR